MLCFFPFQPGLLINLTPFLNLNYLDEPLGAGFNVKKPNHKTFTFFFFICIMSSPFQESWVIVQWGSFIHDFYLYFYLCLMIQ